METFNPAAPRVRAAAAGLLVALVAGTWAYAAHHGWSLISLQETLQARPVLAPALFVLLHCVAAAAFLPCSPFTVAAGLLWGIATGLLISIVAALAASCLTFVIARYFATPAWRAGIAASPPGRVLTGLASLGWKGVAAAQLNPVVPASALGYVFGLTALPLRVYAGAALLSMLPLQVAFVALGASARGAIFDERVALGALVVSFAAGALYLAVRMRARSTAKR